MQVNYGNRRCLKSAVEVVWQGAASKAAIFDFGFYVFYVLLDKFYYP